MGDMAEMIIDGLLCEVCGELIDEDAPGHPRTCGGCELVEAGGLACAGGLSSGMPELDEAIGGIPKGATLEVYAPSEGVGFTGFGAVRAAAESQAQGITKLNVDLNQETDGG